jgi:hypothetical protein
MFIKILKLKCEKSLSQNEVMEHCFTACDLKYPTVMKQILMIIYMPHEMSSCTQTFMSHRMKEIMIQN